MSDLQEKCAVVLQALNDWAVTYAPDMCDPEAVLEAVDRTHQHGTLAYIADASEKMRVVITALSEAEQRVKDARRVALEDAARIADEHAKSHCSGAGGETEAMRLGANSISSMIRALQSEER